MPDVRDYTPTEPDCQEEIQRPGFMLYRDSAYLLRFMPEGDAWRVVNAAITYFLDGIVTQPPFCIENPAFEKMAQDIYRRFKDSIDRDGEKYRRRVMKNRENGKKGGRPKA